MSGSYSLATWEFSDTLDTHLAMLSRAVSTVSLLAMSTESTLLALTAFLKVACFTFNQSTSVLATIVHSGVQEVVTLDGDLVSEDKVSDRTESRILGLVDFH